MKAQTPITTNHLAFPDELFLTTQLRQLGPPAMDRNVVIATINVQIADPRSPELRPIAWKLQ